MRKPHPTEIGLLLAKGLLKALALAAVGAAFVLAFSVHSATLDDEDEIALCEAEGGCILITQKALQRALREACQPEPAVHPKPARQLL